jgi:hypothetical protein
MPGLQLCLELFPAVPGLCLGSLNGACQCSQSRGGGTYPPDQLFVFPIAGSLRAARNPGINGSLTGEYRSAGIQADPRHKAPGPTSRRLVCLRDFVPPAIPKIRPPFRARLPRSLLSLLRGKLRPSGRGCRARRAQYPENADLVGAINVLRAGHARLACEVNSEVSCQQQEPTERAAYPLS